MPRPSCSRCCVALVVTHADQPVRHPLQQAIARLLLREQRPAAPRIEREEPRHQRLARREHVVLCGFGRVGQNIARVLESQGFEYIAVDLDLARVRPARQAGYPVIYGDSRRRRAAATAWASTTPAPWSSPSPTRRSRWASCARCACMRADVPVLVRTQDDTGLTELTDAGATEVVPETFEASLMLVSQVLMLLNVPVSRVVRTVGEIRRARYATLAQHLPARRRAADRRAARVPRGAEVHRGAAGRLGRGRGRSRKRASAAPKWRSPACAARASPGASRPGTCELREGDIVVIYGMPEALEHAEAVLLTG